MTAQYTLDLTLFGLPALHRAGAAIHIPRRKALALLAYLAVEARPHSREQLVELLWPDYTPGDGRADLSRILSVLRRTLGGVFLHADRTTVALHSAADLQVDVHRFRRLWQNHFSETVPENDRLAGLTEAASLYRTDFLDGFTLPSSSDFDNWRLWQAENLRSEYSRLLAALIPLQQAGADLAGAIRSAERLVTLDPFHEPGHRTLIELYASSGRRSDALRHYGTMVKLFDRELGTPPQDETVALYQQIRSRWTTVDLDRPQTEVHIAAETLPPFLTSGQVDVGERRAFVGRSQELAWLNRHLADAVTGQGRVLVVRGDAGRGKTSLLNHFAEQAHGNHPQLLVAGGACNAYAGFGDPYLPFRSVMTLLTGDVESHLAAGTVTREQARRLWQALPLTVQTLTECAPHLLDILVPGRALLARARVVSTVPAPWLRELQHAVHHAVADSRMGQTVLFGECTDFLRHVAGRHPLLITLDDLHWSDEASLACLFHLSRNLAGSRILVVVAYRPEELAAARQAGSHALEKMAAEWQRTYGDITIDLDTIDRTKGRTFVDALIDAEPNRLGDGFRQALYGRTGGHPLFTVELLQDLKARRSLTRNDSDEWVETAALDWLTLPARVEAVIDRRLGHLDAPLRELLRIAATEGEEFTLEIVAEVAGIPVSKLAERFGRELVRRHRLVVPLGMERRTLSGRQLSRYRFQHHLYQTFLYRTLDPIARVHYHEAIGKALEALYATQVDRVAAHLARHWEEARLHRKASSALLVAGRTGARMIAFEEAIAHFQHGLELLQDENSDEERSLLLFDLTWELAQAYWRNGQVAEAIAESVRAMDMARMLGDPCRLAEAVLVYEEPRWRFNLDTGASLRYLREALDALGEEESGLRVRLLVSLARSLLPTVGRDELRAVSDAALQLARRIGDPAALCDALRNRAHIDRSPDTIMERIATVEEMVATARRMDDQERLADALDLVIYDQLELGHIEVVDATIAEHRNIVERTKQPFQLHIAEVYRTMRAILNGEFEQAETLAYRAAERGEQLGVPEIDGILGIHMFTIRAEQGRLSEVAPLVRHFVTSQPDEATWLPGLALIYASIGDREASRDVFEQLSADSFAQVARDSMWAVSLAYLSQVCSYLGDRERAAILYGMLEPFDGHAVVVGGATLCYGAVGRFLGMLAALQADVDRASRHFTGALALDARMGARPWLAHSRYEYARMLLVRTPDADRSQAIQLLQESLTAATEMGMVYLATKIGALQHAHDFAR